MCQILEPGQCDPRLWSVETRPTSREQDVRSCFLLFFLFHGKLLCVLETIPSSWCIVTERRISALFPLLALPSSSFQAIFRTGLDQADRLGPVDGKPQIVMSAYTLALYSSCAWILHLTVSLSSKNMIRRSCSISRRENQSPS